MGKGQKCKFWRCKELFHLFGAWGKKPGSGELIFAIKWFQGEKRDGRQDSPTKSAWPFSAGKVRPRVNQDAMGRTPEGNAGSGGRETGSPRLDKLGWHKEGLAKKGFQQWENDGEGGKRMLNSWRKGVKKTQVTAGQRLPGSDGRNSPEWLELGMGSTDCPSFLT